MSFKRVALAVSGGVDSCVAGGLLKRRGFDVVGVFMRNWDPLEEGQQSCDQDKDASDARRVCDQLQIPFREVNFVKEYWVDVFSYLVESYRNGRTPVADVLCNEHVKFRSFVKFATEQLNADAIATGHYAANSFGNFLENYDPTKRAKLLRPKDRRKDQTLFLCRIPQQSLVRTMFPLAPYFKPEVKQMAVQMGFREIANKAESTGICFIGNRKFGKFIDQYLPVCDGEFVDVDTKKAIGRHSGVQHYTVGQRVKLGGMPQAYFVARLNVETSEVFVAAGTNHPALYSSSLETAQPHWICAEPDPLSRGDELPCQFRFQHGFPEIDCTAQLTTDGGLRIRLCEATRALAIGQFAVLYSQNECLGGAEIIAIGPSLKELGSTEELPLTNRFCTMRR